MRLACRRYGLFLLLLVLSGCALDGPKPVVEERTATPPRRIERHVVTPGETLFSIAWSYGIDFRQLAGTNGLEPPYVIRAGQQLRLPSTAGRSRASARVEPDASSGGQRVTGSDGGRRPAGAVAASPRKPVGPAAGTSIAVGLGAWRWPARGAVAEGYRVHSPAHKGIDIRGELGEPVWAANDGKVVYAGSGLVGYGNLLIIKHNDQYLSAYAHNNRLLVGEGSLVKAGDRIADIGDSGTDSTKLHFEIRRDGEPIDPISMLPGR